MAEHGARYDHGVVVRRASVIVGTRESDEIGDGDDDNSGGKGYSRRRVCIYRGRKGGREREKERQNGRRKSEGVEETDGARGRGGGRGEERGGSTALVRLSSRGDSRTEIARGSRVSPG